jgi:SAM-dependent methyltransferase
MKIPTSIKKKIEKELFLTSWLSIFFNPSYIIRKGLFKLIRKYSCHLKGKLLDFGCGKKPYESMFAVDEYVGLDIESSGHSHIKSKVDVFYDGKTIPFNDNHFDSIFSSEVITHIFNTSDVLSEIYRVLKPDGMFLLTVPFSWFENEIPYDNVRYTSFGIKYTLEEAGFEIIESEKTTNFIQTVIQLFIGYVYYKLGYNFLLRILIIVCVVFPLNVLSIILSIILPIEKSLYCNNVVLAKKKN